MKDFWRMVIAMVGTVAVAGAQPGEPGTENGSARPGKNPRGEQADQGGPVGEPRAERERGERRGPGPRVEGFLKSYDQNRDQAVSFDEFRVGPKMQNMSDEGKKRIFDHLDKNGDGRISRGELPGGGRPEDGGGERLGDKNRDGKISMEEFLDSKRWREAAPELRKGMFKRMDSNGDGFLTPEDFRNRPEGSRPWDRRRPPLDPKALEKLDRDRDGALSFDEWRQNPRYKDIPEERLKEWFGRMDRNQDGKWSPADRPEGRGPEGRPSGGRGAEGPPRTGPRTRPNPERRSEREAPKRPDA